MGSSGGGVPRVDRQELREAIQREYEEVAQHPDQGFHFHTGRALTRIVGYEDAWLEDIPETAIESFAGTGNPFRMGMLNPGERVLDVGSGAGIDSLIAAKQVGDQGRVVGVDMTMGMLERARRAAKEGGAINVEFREGHMEDLPVERDWADVVISNGVLNLAPDKDSALCEFERVLKPGGRLQIADILVTKEVPDGAKQKIDLWTG
ncbi:MAG: methyltransferase domain-containing protein [Myxococcota bacterium]|jgi:SAM-dependent methyltransferase|nr:methyltransferase domain-containing protein [Myxococcota bacterium]